VREFNSIALGCCYEQ